MCIHPPRGANDQTITPKAAIIVTTMNTKHAAIILNTGLTLKSSYPKVLGL